MRPAFGAFIAGFLAVAAAGADEGAASRVIALAAAGGGPIYAVTAERGGLYRSDDRGRSWAPQGSTLPATFLDGATAVGPGTIAVAAHAGAFRSTDGGITWTQFSSVPVMRIWPHGDDTLFVRPWDAPLFRFDRGVAAIVHSAGDRTMDMASTAAGHLISARFGHGVFRSVDGGTSWQSDSEGLVNRDVVAVSVLPSGTLLAGTYFGGAFRRGAGASWEQAARGLPATATVQAFASLTDGRVLAGTYGDGLYVSTDDGRSWQRVAAGDDALAMVTAILPLGGEDVLVGTWGAGVRMVRLDRGASRPAALRMAVTALAEDDAGTVYAVLDGGAIAAAGTDEVSFSPRGRIQAGARSLLAIGEGRVLAGTATSIALSENGGRTWRSVAAFDSPVVGLADAGGGVLFAASAKHGLRRSLDGGQTWEAFETGTEQDFETASMLASDRKGYVVLGTDAGFLATKDFGKTWQMFAVTYGAGSAALNCGGATFIGRWMSAGLFRQADPLTEDFEEVYPWPDFDILIGPLACARDGTLIAVARGVSRVVPTDKHDVWKTEATALANALVRNILVRRNGGLLAATDQGLFGSADDGRRWYSVSVAR